MEHVHTHFVIYIGQIVYGTHVLLSVDHVVSVEAMSVKRWYVTLRILSLVIDEENSVWLPGLDSLY
jgi:hypothetical protein